jgi:iron complex transport system permease protein
MSETAVQASGREGFFERVPIVAALAVVVAVAFIASLLVGPTGFGLPQGSDAASMILWEIRVPRAILGALIGAALGL